MQNFWCAARLMPRREAYATHCLGVAGFTTYLPRLRENRTMRGRKVEVRPPLFPGYIFIAIVLQWHAARWAPGVAHIIMDGMTPARVPDHIIDEIRSRERGGLATQGARLTPGRPGPDHLGTVRASSRAPCRPDIKRIAWRLLLQLLGGRQRTELPANAVEAVHP